MKILENPTNATPPDINHPAGGLCPVVELRERYHARVCLQEASDDVEQR